MFNLLIYIFNISQFYKTFVVFSSTSLDKGRVAHVSFRIGRLDPTCRETLGDLGSNKKYGSD